MQTDFNFIDELTFDDLRKNYSFDIVYLRCTLFTILL